MQRIKGDNIIELLINKSKFVGLACFVSSREEIDTRLALIKKEFSDASHIVYAYRVMDDECLREKFFNSKEPVGSVGKPLLYLLQKKETMNCLLVVVRYFGGKKLGIGGLVRAYTQAGQEALADNLEIHG